MVRRLPQLSSTQINWFDSSILKFDLPSRIMRQWFGVSANARWTQLINRANYKTNDSNVIDCAKVTKIPTPPSAKRYFPPDEHALYKDNFVTGNGELSKVIANNVMEMCFSCFMNTKHKSLRCELPICNKCSELYVMRIFSYYCSQLIVKERPDEHCILAFRLQVYAGTSRASSE